MDLHTAHTQMCFVNSCTSFWRVDKLQKSTIGFFMSVHLYARKISAPIGRFPVSFYTETHIKIRRENQVCLQSDKNNGLLM